MKSLHTLLLLLDVFCGVSCFIGYSCKNNAQPTNHFVEFHLANNLLAVADSLPADTIFLRAAAIPGTSLDSFYLKRLETLDSRQSIDELKRTAAAYFHTRPENPVAKALFAHYAGIGCQYEGKYDSAEVYYAMATQGFKNLTDHKFLIDVLSARSGNMGTMGRYDEAIALNYQVLELLQQSADSLLAMTTQTYLASLVQLKGENYKAIELLKAPLLFFETKRDTAGWNYALKTKGNAYCALQDYEQAFVIFGQTVALRKALGSPPSTIECLYHYGRVLGKLERWQEALDTMRVVEKVISNTSNKQGQAFVNIEIGTALFNLGHYTDAEKSLEKGLQLSNTRKQYPSASSANKILSAIHRKKGDFEKALFFQDQYLSMKDSMFNQEKEKIIAELSVKYETLEKEKQIASLHRQAELALQRNYWILGSFLIVLFGSFFWFQSRAKRKRAQIELEKSVLEATNLVMQQKLENQQLEIASHRNRLDDYTQMLISRNKQLSEFFGEMDTTEKSELVLDKNFTEELYNQVIYTNDDWEKFQRYFNKVFPGYIPTLRSEYPTLTPAEIRSVILHKMGLGLKEQAQIQGITTGAIKQTRYRLNRKFPTLFTTT